MKDRPICRAEECLNKSKPNGENKDGETRYYKLCSPCLKRRYGYRRPSGCKSEEYRPKVKSGYQKGKSCESCGWVAVNSCQLDVDHIDGNHSNNDRSNLKTLCANCHRLKTWENQDWNTPR